LLVVALAHHQAAVFELGQAPRHRPPVHLGQLGQPGQGGPAAAFFVGVLGKRQHDAAQRRCESAAAPGPVARFAAHGGL